MPSVLRGALGLTYDAAAALARAAAVIAPRGRSKLLRALSRRRGIRGRYKRWGMQARDHDRPLLWVHAPSVGEGLQARPVLQIVRAERPDVQLAYTHFSPSAESFAQTLDVDFCDYLPFDTRADGRAVIAALRPTALVFSKLDVWPQLVAAASKARVRVGMISATLAAASSRRSILASTLLRDAYSRLEAVGAIDDADADRLVALGVSPAAITVTGDTRYDQVWERAGRVDRTTPPLARFADKGRPTVVAGSTWPADERPLLAAWAAIQGTLPTARLIIAPHEPTPSHIAPIEGWAKTNKLRVARVDDAAADEADVVLVDRVGILGDLYSVADVAFVGGGFHGAGLHSVLEPAAFGVPVVFGPQHTASRDARLLLATGGGASVPDADTLRWRLETWLADAGRRAEAGASARALVRAGLGAARRSYELVARLLN